MSGGGSVTCGQGETITVYINGSGSSSGMYTLSLNYDVATGCTVSTSGSSSGTYNPCGVATVTPSANGFSVSLTGYINPA